MRSSDRYVSIHLDDDDGDGGGGSGGGERNPKRNFAESMINTASRGTRRSWQSFRKSPQLNCQSIRAWP